VKDEKEIFTRAAGSKTPWLFSVLLGGVGCVCGFVGGILNDTSSNLAPINGLLVGILMAGPAAAVLGWAVGLVLAICKPKPATTNGVFFAFAAGIATITLYLCISLHADSFYADILDAEVVSYEQPSALIGQAKAYWLDEQRKGMAFFFRPDWEKDDEGIKGMLVADKGVVVTVRAYSVLEIFKGGQPWNHGDLMAKPWKREDIAWYSRKYFMRYKGAPEEVTKTGIRQRYLLQYRQPQVDSNPPQYLPAFLNLFELEEVPAELKPFADGTVRRLDLKAQQR
jgi:hypothetical protein